jgi:hypothetical protein
MKSGKSLRFKTLGSISDLPAGMGKMTEALEAFDKMNTSTEALKKKHEKDIVYEKKLSEELKAIRQVRWNSVTVDKSTIIVNINCSAYALHNPYPSTRSP